MIHNEFCSYLKAGWSRLIFIVAISEIFRKVHFFLQNMARFLVFSKNVSVRKRHYSYSQIRYRYKQCFVLGWFRTITLAHERLNTFPLFEVTHNWMLQLFTLLVAIVIHLQTVFPRNHSSHHHVSWNIFSKWTNNNELDDGEKI